MDKFDYGERGYGFAFHDCGKNFGLLIIIIINLINGDVENCRSSKSFGFIYIYRLYRDNNNDVASFKKVNKKLKVSFIYIYIN